MRNRTLVLILCLGGSLLGCSSKPDVGDIEDGLKAAWGSCKNLKMTGLKKTNGVDKGDSYEMAISYKLEVLKDLTVEEAWKPTEGIVCPSEMMRSWMIYGALAQKANKPLAKGEEIEVNDTVDMIKTEKGWVLAQ